ncbi:hypothetical protein [Flagellimonas aequoris]|uniref:EF-hand domain-containing protein n=2 Tax=Flagellimonas aequoris TaxID=2306997 RepID=A0ABY3KV71_9FLAO|nr:hypothetical protein [Allomuricauda aequoris]TXK03758.1 hypothetical protein FQ019_05880 [Allomuricauda aequoris]
MSYNQMGILLAIIVIAFVGITWKKVNNPYLKSLWRTALLVFTLYAALLIYIEIHWQFIAEYASKYDLNGNGFVDLNEYSEEAMDAMNKRTYGSKVRIYAPATMAVLSSIIGFAFLVSDVTVTRLKQKKSEKKL